MATDAELANRFAYHPATEDTGPRHDTVRELHRDLAYRLNALLPEGRHKSLALTSLQESMMWANAAIACDT